MPIDEKQKSALKEKYKEHRRAVWRGETSRSKKNEVEKEDDIETVIDLTTEETVIEDFRDSDSSQRKWFSFHDSEEVTENTELEDETTVREIDYTVVEQETTGRKTSEHCATLLDSDKQIQRIHSSSDNAVQSELIDKIKEQRRAAWAGESSTKVKLKDKNRKRKTPEVEQKVHDETNEEKGGITWKLAIAVIIAITGTIGLGVYLGYILASYL